MIQIRKIFTERELSYIRNNYQDKTYPEITVELNKFNDIKKDSKQVRTKASQLGLSKQKYHYNRGYFKTIDTEDKAYWLGFIYADGNVSNSKHKDKITGAEVCIKLHGKDAGHLKKFIRCLKPADKSLQVTYDVAKDRYIKGVFVKGGAPVAMVRLYSTEMFNDLVSLDLVPNKTYSSEFPKVEDDVLFIHFLRGFLDGDGHIAKDTMYFMNNNKDMLHYIKYRLEEMGFITGNLFSDGETRNRLYFSGDNRRGLLHLLYHDSNMYLDRKYKTYKKYTKHGSNPVAT